LYGHLRSWEFLVCSWESHEAFCKTNEFIVCKLERHGFDDPYC